MAATEQRLQDYLDLVVRIDAMDKHASYYLMFEAPKLKSFTYNGDLSCAFVWSTTPQGHDYWACLEAEDYKRER